MYQIQKGKPFYFALTSLIYTCNIPRNLEKSHLKPFFIKFVFVKILIILLAIAEPLLHAVISVKNRTGIDISEDIAVVIGSITALSVCIMFTVQFKQWTDFMSDVTSFGNLGDASSIEKRMAYFNIVTISYYGFCVVGIMIYAMVNFTQSKECKHLNEENDLHEICGTFYPIWLPVTETNTASIIIISIPQLLICITILPAAAMVSCIMWESTEILIIHIGILKECFINLFEGPGNTTDRLRFCVNYHIHILSMANRLNTLVKRTASHMAFMAAMVFGVILNQMLQTTAITGAIFLIGYITGIFLLCHAGEIIKNETLSIVDAVWASNWHKADAQAMRDLAFVIFRGQQPVYFEALPLGRLDYPLFVMILKTSYSYLTLLNQTM